MNYEMAFKRLVNHANLPLGDDIPLNESIVFAIWQSTRQDVPVVLGSLVQNVLECIQIINVFVNRDNTNQAEQTIDKILSLAINTIIEDCLEYSLIWEKKALFDDATRLHLRNIAWIISTAWCAVLHGDIDSAIDYVILDNQTKCVIDDDLSWLRQQ